VDRAPGGDGERRRTAAAADASRPRAAGAAMLVAAAAAALSALALVANLSAAALDGAPAAAARAALAPTCHQLAERSLHVGGRPLGACARCTGLHASGLAAAALALVLGCERLAAARRGLRRLAVGAGALLVADALAGSAIEGWDAPLLRLLTGVAAGGLLLLWGIGEMSGERSDAPTASGAFA
jgi:uncharacterized membrane protein